MMIVNRKLKKFVLTLAVSSLVSLSALATPLDLKHEPMFLSQSVPPGMVVTIDDSGSMRWGYMPDSRFNGTARGYYNAWNNNQRVISFTSPDYNAIYYDPSIVYSPPVNHNGDIFPDSIYTNALVEGYGGVTDIGGDTNIIRTDLSSEYIPVTEIYPSRNGPGEATWRLHNNVVAQGGFYHLWNEALPNFTIAPNPLAAENTYYDIMRVAPTGGSAQNFTRHNMNTASAAEKTNFANWYTYYNTRNKLAKAALSRAFVQFGPDFKLTWQVFHDLRLDSTTQSSNMGLFETSHREDFYNWLFAVRATAATPLRRATMLAGQEFEKKGTGSPPTNSPYWSDVHQQEMSCQQNFHIQLSDGYWNSQSGLTADIDGTDWTFPEISIGSDSKTYAYNPGSTPPQVIYKGGDNDTVADNAFYYWSRDLRPGADGLDNQVPPFISEYKDHHGNDVVLASNEQWWMKDELFWNPKNDPATWQHMVNFNIGLGVNGEFDQVVDYPSLRDGTSVWSSNINGRRKVDDVWQASINSRGEYFSAKNPNELVSALDNVISSIIARKGKASSGSVSSSIISDETLAFKTGFDTSTWSGFVTASILNSDGTIGSVVWDAGCKLTGGSCSSMSGEPIVAATNDHSSRTIFSYDKGSKIQYNFNSGDMPSSRKASLMDSNFIIDAIANSNFFTAQQIIDYIRGERDNEITQGGNFRNRQNLLGDVIHSPARVIRGPAATYKDSVWYSGSPEDIANNNGNGYKDFKVANQNRDNVLIVGANDGMLHAFDAGINTVNGGHELWAYVPSSSIHGLSELANPNYVHETFVDSAPFIKDAFINSQWSTVALGGLRLGGKLFYALDLGADTTNTPDVLWEFSDDDDSDMGFSYGGGVIARVVAPLDATNLQSKWVAFIPNGYNSTSQKSVLYAIDLENGDLLHKWNTGLGSDATPNGLGPVTAADYIAYADGDTSTTYFASDLGVDFVYGGDLHGNVYRFDTSKIFSDPGGVTTDPHILFEGNADRAITIAPRVFAADDDSSKVVVTFGTGKFLEPNDKTLAITEQYIIGIKDSEGNNATLSLGDLVEQTISQIGGKRTLSNNGVTTDQSWKIELIDSGERLVNQILRIPPNKMLVTTIIPSGDDPCEQGGKSWIMAINSMTGGQLARGSRLFSGNTDGVAINDLVLNVNLLTTPGGNQSILMIDGTEGDDGGSEIDPIVIESGEKWRRRSWHRILF